jgi:hypothetical protein|tara:strand:- start:96 stop:287 length:192 start_codon:yes stop_codon:yes gene_type:complete
MEIMERAWDARDILMQIGGLVVVAASMMVAGTKTPDPGTLLGRAYKLIEWASLSFGKSKDTGK